MLATEPVNIGKSILCNSIYHSLRYGACWHFRAGCEDAGENEALARGAPIGKFHGKFPRILENFQIEHRRPAAGRDRSGSGSLSPARTLP